MTPTRILMGVWALLLSGIVCLAQISPLHPPVTGPLFQHSCVPTIAGAFGSTSASGTTFSPALPTCITANNLLLAWCYTAATPNTITISVDGAWTLLDSFPSPGFNDVSAWAWRIANGSDTAPTFTGSGSISSFRGSVLQYSGLTGSPIGNRTHSTGTSTTMSIAAVTTTANNSIISVIMANGLNTNVPATPTHFTSDVSAQPPSGSATGSYRAVRETIATSGSMSDTGTATISTSGWVTFVLELKTM